MVGFPKYGHIYGVIPMPRIAKSRECGLGLATSQEVSISVGRYHFFTSGIRYGKFRTVFGISRYLIKQNCSKKIV